jgi:hypothetical protein
MMNPRRVVGLLVVAAVVLAAGFWISGANRHDSSNILGKPVLPDLKKALNDVKELRFAKADGTHATLRKEDTDWVVVERNFAADSSRVRKLLLDLSALEVVEEKTSNPARYADLSVEDVPAANPTQAAPAKPAKEPYDFSAPIKATRIDIVTPAKTWTLINGKSGGGKSGYVRVVGGKESLLASPRLDADAEPQRWLDKTIIDLPQARIQSVALQPSKGPAYTVSRDKRETENFTVSNIPKGRKLSYEGSGNAVANSLESVSLDDVNVTPASPPALAAGVTVESSKATYRTFDGVTVDIAGRKESTPGIKKDDPKVEHFYITLAVSSTDKATQAEAQKLDAHVKGREFEISSYKYEGMFKPLDDLLEPLPAKPEKPEKKAKASP